MFNRFKRDTAPSRTSGVAGFKQPLTEFKNNDFVVKQTVFVGAEKESDRRGSFSINSRDNSVTANEEQNLNTYS